MKLPEIFKQAFDPQELAILANPDRCPHAALESKLNALANQFPRTFKGYFEEARECEGMRIVKDCHAMGLFSGDVKEAERAALHEIAREVSAGLVTV